MINYKNYVHRVGLIAIVTLILNVRGFILLPILSTSLGPSGYGTWVLVSAGVTLCSNLVTIGLSSSIVQFLSGEKCNEDLRDGVYSSLLFSAAVGLLVGILIALYSDTVSNIIFHSEDLIAIIRISTIYIFVGGLEIILLQFFRARLQIIRYSTFQLFECCGELILIYLALLYDYGLMGVLISAIVIHSLNLGIMFLMTYFQIGIKKPNFTNLNYYLIFGLSLLPTYLFHWIISLSDRYIIGFFGNNTLVGIYAAAYGIGSIILLFMGPIAIVIYPTMAGLWDNNEELEAKKLIEYSAKFIVMLSIPSILGLFIMSKPILLNLAGPEFINGSDLIFIIASGALLYNLAALNEYIILVTSRKSKIILNIFMISAVLYISFNLLLIPLLGIMGAAISNFLCFLFLFSTTYLFARTKIKYKLEKIFLSKIIISSIIMCLFVHEYNPMNLFDVFLCVFLGGIIYISLLVLMNTFNGKEKIFLKYIYG